MRSNADHSVPTRQSLLVRLKRWDDTGGWREFFETYWELIYKVATKAGLSDAEAQDVVQETVLAVACKIENFKTDPKYGSFKSWLLGQARWRIGDQFRARKRAGRILDSPVDAAGANEETRTDPLHRVPDPVPDPLEAMWDNEWEAHLLRQALERVKAQVSVKQFQLFELHVHQGLTVGETARALNTTKAAVYMAKSRVGRVLKREIGLLRIQ